MTVRKEVKYGTVQQLGRIESHLATAWVLNVAVGSAALQEAITTARDLARAEEKQAKAGYSAGKATKR